MDINKKLKDIADYFKKKILDGDFSFESCGQHTAIVMIDEKYRFKLWIDNDPKDFFNFYADNIITMGGNPHLKFKTQEERLRGWEKVKPSVEEYRKRVLITEKLSEIEELKKEIEELS